MDITIRKGDCRECYRCSRVCTLNAINIKNGHAVIDDTRCVGCGECIAGCPQGLIEVDDIVLGIEKLMDSGVEVVASIHWSWFQHLGNMAERDFLQALKGLGFGHISEALWGVKIYNQTLRGVLPSHLHELRLVTPCPVARRMVEMHHPELRATMVDLANPFVLHARMMRKLWGDGIRVVHFAPCHGFEGAVDGRDFVVTFGDLRRWMDRNVIAGDESGVCFEPGPCPMPVEVSMSGAMLRARGVDRIEEVLANLGSEKGVDASGHGVALKLVACGGCSLAGGVTGCDFTESVGDYLIAREHYKAKKYLDDIDVPRVETRVDSNSGDRQSQAVRVDSAAVGAGVVKSTVSRDQIREAFESLLKFNEHDHHNCNACGYGTCLRFARAMAEGKVDRDVCLSYTRKQLYAKFKSLIEVIPSGIMLVDSDLRVVQANATMVALLGAGAKMVDDVDPGMLGADVRKLVNFSDLLKQVFDTGLPLKEREVECNERMLSVSIFGIDGSSKLCVVASPLLESEIFDDSLISHTEQVMADNLRSVEQIATLLGQNAARMESVLRSIVVKKKNKQ